MRILDMIRALPGAVVEADEYEENVWEVTIPLGGGFAGKYEGGLWGDVEIANDELELCVRFGDVYDEGVDEDEFTFDCGNVPLDYVGNDGYSLAYGGPLEDAVCERIVAVTNGLLDACGSEQGMQGEESLNLDIFLRVPAEA